MMMKQKTCSVHGHGFFFNDDNEWQCRRWSSFQAWAVFILNNRKDDVVCIRKLRQWPINVIEKKKKKNDEEEQQQEGMFFSLKAVVTAAVSNVINRPTKKPGGSLPYFGVAEFKRMKEFAFEKLTRDHSAPVDAIRVLERAIPHQIPLCEMCAELGYPCTSQLTDVMGVVLYIPKHIMQARVKRLKSGDTMVLYHQTTTEIAKKILDSQEFRPGTEGLAGGGIYFAVTPEETEHKAHQHGAILRASVQLGNVRELTPSGDPDMTTQKMLKDGYDSVMIPRPGGTEYVVYFSDQVKDISLYESKK